MQRNPQSGRHGFTLLEVMLAAIIAALLMAALYTAMDVQLRYAQSGREVVDQTMLARQILARITADLNASLTPITAVPVPKTSTSSSSSSSTTGGTTTDPAAATDVNPNAGQPALTSSGVTPFSCGLTGDSGLVTVWVSKLPQGRGPVDRNADSQELDFCDIRRVSYWLDGGLRMQNLRQVTADNEESQLPPPNGELIAPEVEELSFRYFDGATWVDMWDGTVFGADGATPVGPPRAIEVTIGIRHPSSPDKIVQYKSVVAINSANAQPVAADPTTTGGGGGG